MSPNDQAASWVFPDIEPRGPRDLQRMQRAQASNLRELVGWEERKAAAEAKMKGVEDSYVRNNKDLDSWLLKATGTPLSGVVRPVNDTLRRTSDLRVPSHLCAVTAEDIIKAVGYPKRLEGNTKAFHDDVVRILGNSRLKFEHSTVYGDRDSVAFAIYMALPDTSRKHLAECEAIAERVWKRLHGWEYVPGFSSAVEPKRNPLTRAWDRIVAKVSGSDAEAAPVAPVI